MSSEKNKSVVKRDERGRILPGQGSLNPGGKTRGIEKVMREIIAGKREKWDGTWLSGWEAMTMMMYEVAMGRKPPGMSELDIRMKDRMAAVQFLFDRVHGKAKIQIEADTTVRPGGLENLDVDNLDPSELDALEAHVELLAAKAAGKTGPAPKIIDVDPIDAEMSADPNPDDVK